MHRIDGAGHVNNLFVSEDPATNRPPTEITPEIMNAFQQELAAIVEWSGAALDKADNGQVLTALIAKFADRVAAATKAGVQNMTYSAALAGGAANAITAVYDPPITALVHGMSVRVRAASANTTTTPTFTPNSVALAAKTIVKGNNLALVAGDISGAGHWLDFQWDQTLDKWVLLNPAKGVSISSVDATKQPLDATLTSLAALVTAPDKLIYATGIDTFALTPFPEFARSFLAGASAAADAMTILGLRTEMNAAGNAPMYTCRAWVNFNGTGTLAIDASGNVSSVTDNGTGIYTVNFANAMPDANYAVAGFTVGYGNTGYVLYSVALMPGGGGAAGQEPVAKTTSSVRVMHGQTTAAVFADSADCSISIFR